MKELNRQNVKELSQAMMDSLIHLEKKHGIKFTYKGGRFTSSNVTFKVEAAVVAGDGQVMTRESQDFTLQASYYGMKGSWLNEQFNYWGNKYKVVGLKPRSYKNPVIVEREDGKRFKMRPEMIIDAFKTAKV